MDQKSNSLKVIQASFSDIEGGAARAAYRLHNGLRHSNVHSRMLVLRKARDDNSVEVLPGRFGKIIARIAPMLDSLPIRLYPDRPYYNVPWSTEWMPYPISSMIKHFKADLLHLHWIGGGFIPIGSLSTIGKPLVWTLHDEWAFTGGCHYTGGCEKFTQSCGECPQLGSHIKSDLSHWTWEKKRKAWKALKLTVIAPSHWIAGQIKRSALLHSVHVEVIPNGIDTSLYRPIDRKLARSLLNLPQDKRLVLFGAMSSTSDPRKGFQHLQSTLYNLAANGWLGKAELVIFGASEPMNKPPMGLPDHYMGYLFDDLSLALLYSAVDVFVAPSLEDNLPNTVMEALACGTPSVAFNIGGMSDLIEHQSNGYLAQPFDTEALAYGLSWVLQDEARYQELSYRARQKVVTEFAIAKIAHRHFEMYSEICNA